MCNIGPDERIYAGERRTRLRLKLKNTRELRDRGSKWFGHAERSIVCPEVERVKHGMKQSEVIFKKKKKKNSKKIWLKTEMLGSISKETVQVMQAWKPDVKKNMMMMKKRISNKSVCT